MTWRTLAEPTYGIDGNQQAVTLESGAEIQIINEPRPDGTVEIVARPAGGADDWDAYNDVLVTASALRFEDASLGERLGFQAIHDRTYGYNGQEHR